MGRHGGVDSVHVREGQFPYFAIALFQIPTFISQLFMFTLEPGNHPIQIQQRHANEQQTALFPQKPAPCWRESPLLFLLPMLFHQVRNGPGESGAKESLSRNVMGLEVLSRHQLNPSPLPQPAPSDPPG